MNTRIAFLEQSLSWSRKQLLDYQWDSLTGLLRHAHRHVPYFRHLFKDKVPLTCWEDFYTLPLMDKNMIKASPDDFIVDHINRAQLNFMTSGGSTGEPLKIWMDDNFKALNHANTYFYLRQQGFEPGKFKSVRLHGDHIPQENLNQGKFWVLDGKKLIMSTYHINEDNIQSYAEALNSHQPAYIHAYPSALSLLAQIIKQHNIKLSITLKCVFCDCETLYPVKKQLIEEVFNCPVINIYGHTEGAVFGLSCQQTGQMHLFPQVGIVELLDAQGKPVQKVGEKGEIVVTGFNNRIQPFIRYRTYDIGVFAGDGCSCDWPYLTLSAIEGRVQDYVVNGQGRLVPLAPALFDYHVDWSNISKFQVHQVVPGKLTFNLVMSASSLESAEALTKRIAKAFTEVFNQEFTIDVKLVDAIGFTRIGKYRYLHQEIDLTKGNFIR